MCTFAVAALAGCAVVQVLPALPSVLALCMAAGLALLLLVVRRLALLRLPAVIVVFGCWAALHAAHRMANRLEPGLEGTDLVITGRIADLPRRRGADIAFLFQPVPRAGEPHLGGPLRLTWYRANRAPAPCEYWRLTVRLRRPRGVVNPGGSDAERRALLAGVVATGYVRPSPTNARLAQGRCINGWRDAIGKRVDGVIGGREARVLKALAVGDTRGLDAADWDVARATGTSHLIAISGFHIGVAAGGGVLLVRGVYVLLPWLATRLPRRIAQAVFGMGVALGYGLLAGMGLPTVRALLMVAVLVIAAVARRRAGGLSLLAFALLAVLVVDPLAVLAPGFWLSFAGVAFLMACVAPAASGWYGRLMAMVRTQAVMSVALLPVSLWLFGSASLVSFAANVIAAPLVSFAVIPLVLVGCASLPLAAVASPLLQAASALLQGLWRVLTPLAAVPGGQLTVPDSGPWTVLLATAAATWVFAPRGVPLRGFALLGFLPLLVPLRESTTPGGFRAWVLDVGQGLAVLVRTRTHTLVYDAGPELAAGHDAGAGIVLPAVTALGMGPVDMLVVSHGDNDHAGGARSVQRRYPGARVLSGEPDRLPFPAEDCAAIAPWEWDGVGFRFMAVPGPTTGKVKANERSCVMAIEGTGGRLLLTGDIGAVSEARMLAADLVSALPTVTTIAHHGSRHSSSAAWLRKVRPGVAVASSGWRNRFGHPHPLVVDRHAAVGAQVYDTARSGAVRIDVPASGAPRVAREWRRPANRYWRE
ncbi:DNA internalization-related competence protein ComEC/Rec2 [Luteibacter aegosomatissinici]|uniref:DNA internalization-related competence protein ComEC/Rec2 n=1 Tax=Luteibacter aegosomatissinici TaxID=2911539 RepID=UPI001FF7E3D7|nr:DNA internalization-related competence protein ComEC/Rec2 [Luteibacter aegosomatissinici]UPG92921.1 DNA internalization-related competence protein ComEC/Rec2 [Luteibacter aegosomatissinici]